MAISELFILKRNLRVAALLDGIESSQLTCEITADFDIISTSDPCNPNTSIVPIGDHVMTIKIRDKLKTTVLQISEIKIKNPPINTDIDITKVTIGTAWQSPTYLLSKDDTSLISYNCDPEEPECKINLLVTPLLA